MRAANTASRVQEGGLAVIVIWEPLNVFCNELVSRAMLARLSGEKFMKLAFAQTKCLWVQLLRGKSSHLKQLSSGSDGDVRLWNPPTRFSGQQCDVSWCLCLRKVLVKRYSHLILSTLPILSSHLISSFLISFYLIWVHSIFSPLYPHLHLISSHLTPFICSAYPILSPHFISSPPFITLFHLIPSHLMYSHLIFPHLSALVISPHLMSCLPVSSSHLISSHLMLWPRG